MNWYWIVSNDKTVENPFIGDKGDLEGLDDWMFRKCIPIQMWSGEGWVQATDPENDGDPDDCLQNLFGLPILSQRVREALDDASIAGIQYLPIHVWRPQREEIEGYCIGNLLNCVEALDLG